MSWETSDYGELKRIRIALEKRNALLEEQNELLKGIDDKLFKIYGGMP